MDEEHLVLMIGKEVYSEQEHLRPGWEAEMETKLSHIPRNNRRRFETMLRKSGLVGRYVYNLVPADVPIKHHFKLKTDTPVYYMGRRQSLKHKRIVSEELQKMSKADVILPVTSEWSSPVVIATKKDEQPRFCVD